MAKAEKPEPIKSEAIKLSLVDFCARLSETVKRPELIGAFEFVERTAGRTADTEEAFRARFSAFTKKPV